MSDTRIVRSQTKEEAQRNIAALFSMGQPTQQDFMTHDNPGTECPDITSPLIPQKRNDFLPPENGDVLAELPIDLLLDFPKEKHRFREYTAAEMEEMQESIALHGILQPPLVRPHPGKAGYYEIVAGHNRRTGAKNIGYTSISCIIRNMTDDEALLQMINSNLRQRPGLLPSEKAWAYRDMLDALKRQGKRTDLMDDDTCAQPGHKSRDTIAEQVGESRETIRRYIRLTYLTPELLAQVDAGKLGLTVGETLSYLSTISQQIVDTFFFGQRSLNITQAMAAQLRELEDDNRLDAETLEATFLSSRVAPKKIKWAGPMKTVRDKYFDKKASDDDVANTIDKALEAYFKKEETPNHGK